MERAPRHVVGFDDLLLSGPLGPPPRQAGSRISSGLSTARCRISPAAPGGAGATRRSRLAGRQHAAGAPQVHGADAGRHAGWSSSSGSASTGRASSAARRLHAAGFRRRAVGPLPRLPGGALAATGARPRRRRRAGARASSTALGAYLGFRARRASRPPGSRRHPGRAPRRWRCTTPAKRSGPPRRGRWSGLLAADRAPGGRRAPDRDRQPDAAPGMAGHGGRHAC